MVSLLAHHALSRLISTPERPDIEEANKNSPAFSRIFKEMILVTREEKPMLRAGKGTVIKKETVKLYSEEINAL